MKPRAVLNTALEIYCTEVLGIGSLGLTLGLSVLVSWGHPTGYSATQITIWLPKPSFISYSFRPQKQRQPRATALHLVSTTSAVSQTSGSTRFRRLSVPVDALRPNFIFLQLGTWALISAFICYTCYLVSCEAHHGAADTDHDNKYPDLLRRPERNHHLLFHSFPPHHPGAPAAKHAKSTVDWLIDLRAVRRARHGHGRHFDGRTMGKPVPSWRFRKFLRNGTGEGTAVTGDRKVTGFCQASLRDRRGIAVVVGLLSSKGLSELVGVPFTSNIDKSIVENGVVEILRGFAA
ncbi:hypothetical protein B0H10DRAFT_2358265 [Mycena sp. CBHHK59/15]|nr:hypothetical protein B0H10DRAFT_2358265 [Mycena sp. CBHHK59/15]